MVSITTPFGRPQTAKVIHPGNAFLSRCALERWDAATNHFVPWTGQAVTVTFALDADGAQPIPALDGLTMAELAVAPGTYAVQIHGPTMQLLVPYLGMTVYEIHRDFADQVHLPQPYVVQFPRYPLVGA